MYSTSRHVIVVNDDAIQLQALARFLEEEGLKVLAFDNADQALKVMGNTPPDLIITDLHMPGIDGWRFCRLLRSPEYVQFNQTPILVVSATFSGEDPRRITAGIGANGFHPAPIRKSRFIEQVRSLLAGEVPPFTPDVLIIDDSKSVVHLLCDAFKAHGYRSYSALKGADGIQVFRSHQPDMVIIDYHLPDMTGDEVLAELKQLNSQTVFIMITMDPRPELALEWMHKGAAAYVRKPFDPQYLISLCEHARRERSLLYIEDILEKRTQELWESEARYRLIYENSPEMMCSVDARGRICDVNQKWLLEMGYTREEVIGKPAGFALTPESANQLFPKNKPCPSRMHLRDTPSRHLRRTGEIMDTLVNCETVTDISGKRITLCVIRDVTEQKRAEEERLRLAAQIHKFESLNVMAGSIAHNFNNLLMGVLGNIEIVLMKLPPDAPEARCLKAAEQAGRRAAELSTLMLTYAGKGRVNIKSIDLTLLVQEMTTLFELSFTGNVSFKLVPAPDAVFCKGDPSLIRQIVMNLVNNAVESLGESKGIVTLSTGRQFCKKADLRQPFLGDDLPEGDYAFLNVSDTGCGMNTEILSKVFDPFFTTKFTGRGLGLAAVLGIVRSHRGSLCLKSRPGKGTSITIWLPATNERPASAETEKNRGSHFRTDDPRTILLVDDEGVVLDVAGNMLNQLGFNVITAANGQEALRLFRQRSGGICCIILDLSMPQMDGVKAFSRFQQIAPDVPVILSSGYPREVAARRFTDVCPLIFIQKPYDLAGLKKTLEKILTP